MNWFNYYGLAIMAIIMAPNIVYAIKHKNIENKHGNKAAEISEQIGRYGCFVFMIFNIPYTCFGFWFGGAKIVYLSVNGGLCIMYLLCWVIFWNRQGIFKALTLSVIPSILFLFSGIVAANIPLIVLAVLFGISHVYISCTGAGGGN